MRYVPEIPSANTADLTITRQYLADELQRVSNSLREIEGILLPTLHVEPLKPRDGMVILVDGTNFNPGSGAGFYGRSAGAWVFLG